MAGIPTFLRVEDEVVYFKGKGKKLVFYAPEKWFTTNCATIDGQYIDLLGCVNYSIMPEESTDYAKKVRTLNYPYIFTTRPGSIIKVKNFQISENMEPENYRLLIYTDNTVDEVISSTKVAQDIMNVEYFLRLFIITGKIPKTIPVNKLHETFLDNIKYSGNNYKVSAQLFGILLSEFCRCKDDPSIPFRLAKPKNGDMTYYETLPVSKLPKFNGPFNSLTSENWDESLMGAMLYTDSKGSPLEDIMMGDWAAVNDNNT